MASNFFQQQDWARRNTSLLILLFCLAVLSLIALTNLLVMLSFATFQGNRLVWDWGLVAIVSLIVITIVGLAMLAKWQQLKMGGRAIAEALGGERLHPNEQDPLKRRLLNVVEEMALAANLPVPPVYVLAEQGINAFAAGYSSSDAVIGVTQGALEQLSRDELQGVVAHEFSHILNGDMRLNIRLIAILNGILFLGHLGYFLLRSSSRRGYVRSRNSRNDGTAVIAVLALSLMVIGYLGSFFGNLIKAAVSRQREYLADASAVQFSRNPRGIAGALKRIGGYQAGSRVRHANADEISHLFFGEALSRWTAIFATHPPLAKRIRRLDPHWNGRFPSPQPKQVISPAQAAEQPQERQRRTLLAAIPVLLSQSSHQTRPAQAIVCALLLDPAQLAQQLTQIKAYGGQNLLQEVDQLADAVQRLPLAQQVQLLQMSVPALKLLDATEFRAFDHLLRQLAGPVLQLKQWLCLSLLEHVVACEFDPQEVVKDFHRQGLEQLLPQILPLLSAVSSAAGNDEQQQQAWQAAMQSLSQSPDLPRPQVDFTRLDQALQPLLRSSPLVKEQLWQAILSATLADKHKTEAEQGLVNFLGLLLEMPVPLTADFN